MPTQPDLEKQTFQKLKQVLARYSPPMIVSKNSKGVYELIGNKEVPYGSKKQLVPGMYFSSAVIKKTQVSFYFFPIYFHEAEFLPLIPGLNKYLKGKTCFHFKNPEQVNERELEVLIEKGIQAFQIQGFMK